MNDETRTDIESNKGKYETVGCDCDTFERYAVEYDKNAYKCIFDKKSKDMICGMENIVDLLNEQDGMIKKLGDDNIDCVVCEKYDERLVELEMKIRSLERKEKKREKDKLRWALNQFRYKEKTEEEKEALRIIDKVIMENRIIG